MNRQLFSRGMLLTAAMVLAVGFGVQAKVLYQEDFNSNQIKGYQGDWTDGGYSGSGAGKGSFHAQGGFLDGGNGDSPSADLVRWVTGDAGWADVAVSSHITVNGQNTGWVALLARYQNVKSFYMLRYTTGSPERLLDGDRSPTGDPDLQIAKVVGGTLTVLAETSNGLPAINGNGADNAAGAVFKLVADGDTLTALVNGKQLLSVKDTSLKAGKVGVAQQEYYPLWDDITVETAE